jgi:hypothetical protein
LTGDKVQPRYQLQHVEGLSFILYAHLVKQVGVGVETTAHFLYMLLFGLPTRVVDPDWIRIQ